jgi:outer membrane receptor protein involved in Fe transport
VATEMDTLARKFPLAYIDVSLFSERLSAGQRDPNKQVDSFEMSLEELMDVPLVVSASRQAQKISELSVPMSAITAEDIHYSGLTNIPEILQFVSAMDVLKFNRFSYAAGVRGLHELISDKVQSLIDDQLMDNAVYGGPEFWNIPILIEDIERIEIVRSPGGSSWGANAFTNAINIITKKPDDVLGKFASSTITEFGDTYNHIRWAETQESWRWRDSVGYEDNKSLDDVLDEATFKSFQPLLNSLMGFENFKARDFSRNLRFDSQVFHKVSQATESSFGLGYSHFESGDFKQMGYFPMEDIRSEMVRSFARIDHKFKEDTTGYIEWFGNFQNSKRPNYLHYITSENAPEGQLNFAPVERHNTSIGANTRYVHINTKDEKPQEYVLPGKPYDEYWAGAFAIDRWQTTDRLTIEGQVRTDWYTETNLDWAGRLTALCSIDEQNEHVFRLSTARAFRTPLIALRRFTVQRLQIPFDGYLIQLLPADELDNEHTWSIEAGYTGKVFNKAIFRADAYYQRFDHLISGINTGALTVYKIFNFDGGTSCGAECELSIANKQGKLSAWYAYNFFETDKTDQPMRGMKPAKHKAGLSCRLFLPADLVFNVNYKFTDTTPENDVVTSISTSIRLDLTISKEFAANKGELMLGVSDVLDKNHDPFNQCDTLTTHETSGRMFFVRLQLRF